MPEQQDVSVPYTPLHLGRQEVAEQQHTEDEENLHAIDFGLALHYALELCDLHCIASADQAMSSVKNRFGERLEHKDFDAIQKRIVALLNDTAFQELIEGTCHKEQPISYDNELRYIDLLVERHDDAVVIDYKSSRRFEEKHRAQVEFYKKAIETILQKKVCAYVVYLLEDGVEVIPV